MKGFLLVGLLASFVGACGNGRGGTGGPGDPDGGAQVTVVTGEPPALIVYREEADTAWKTPASPSTGRFELDVTGPYRLIIVCGDPGPTVQVTQLALTSDEQHMIELSCSSSSPSPSPPPFHVRGQMLQPGEAFFHDTGRGADRAPFSFDLPTSAGTFDFIALFGDLVNAPVSFAIRRDITVASDVDLGAIGAAQEPAQALVPTRFTASNLDPGESRSASLLVESGNTFAVSNLTHHPELAWQVNLVPGTALRSTDTQSIQLTAESPVSDQPLQQTMRGISRSVRDGDSTSVTLMDRLGPTTFDCTADRLVATWTSLPEYDQITITHDSFAHDSAHFVNHAFFPSRAFLTSTGTTTVTLDFTDVPGFQPEWRHDPTTEQSCVLDVSRSTPLGDGAFSEVRETIPASTASGAGPPRVDPQRARALIDAHRAQLQRLHRAARPGAR